MKLDEKIPMAKQTIRFISRHDDAPIEEVNEALDALIAFIKEEKKESAKRRAEKVEAE